MRGNAVKEGITKIGPNARLLACTCPYCPKLLLQSYCTFFSSYGNMLDKKRKRRRVCSVWNFALPSRALLLVPHIIIYIVSSYSNIQEKKVRGGKLAQFGTALWAKALQPLDIRPMPSIITYTLLLLSFNLNLFNKICV